MRCVAFLVLLVGVLAAPAPEPEAEPPVAEPPVVEEAPDDEPPESMVPLPQVVPRTNSSPIVPPPPPTDIPIDGGADNIGACDDLVMVGYRFGSGNDVTCSGVHGAVCYTLSCAAGYTGTASGMSVCQQGVWRHVVAYSGCVHDSAPPAADCADFTPVVGYSGDCESGGAHASGTYCTFTCSGGHVGTPVANQVACFDGTWYGAPTGCRAPFDIPSAICTPGTGFNGGLVVKAVYPEHSVDENTCKFSAGGFRMPLLRVECAVGFKKTSGYTGEAVAFGNTFYGGWARAPPACAAPTPEEASSQLFCNCGAPGRRSVAARPLFGLTRTNSWGDSVGGDANHWDCFVLPGTRRTVCSCECNES